MAGRETGRRLESARIEELGGADRVVATKDDTTIVGGHGSESLIKGRIQQIKAEIEKTASDYDREKLQERLAKLSGGVAIIRVGAATEVELEEKKHRVEDALSATRAAIEEGIFPGGGVALLNTVSALDGVSDGNRDVVTGVNILRRALEEPMRRLAENAGYDGAVVVQEVRRHPRMGGNPHVGFDVLKEEYGNMIAKGTIDPAKVTRSALENVASIAAMVLTTEAVITDMPEKERVSVPEEY